jgi:hypothetical protein
VEFGLKVLTRWQLCFCTTIHILVIFIAWRYGQATEQDSQCVDVVAGVSALARRDMRAGAGQVGRLSEDNVVGHTGKLRSRRHDLTWLQRASFGQQRNMWLCRVVFGLRRAQTLHVHIIAPPWLDTYLPTLGS